MSLGIYKVEWEPLHYIGSIGDREFDFVQDYRRDDGTYYIEEDMLTEQIEAYKADGKEEELPQEFIQFLRERLKEEGEAFSISIG